MMLVLCVTAALGILLSLGAWSSLLGSTTARTLARASELQVLGEVGEAAIAEAVAHVRASLDRGAASPPECRDDWSKLVQQALSTGAPVDGIVLPVRLRERLATRLPEVAIAEVRVTLRDTFAGGAYRGGPPRSPQGVMEMTVEVLQGGGLLGQRRVVRQRRVWYATPRGNAPAGCVTLVAAPLATVLE